MNNCVPGKSKKVQWKLSIVVGRVGRQRCKYGVESPVASGHLEPITENWCLENVTCPLLDLEDILASLSGSGLEKIRRRIQEEVNARRLRPYKWMRANLMYGGPIEFRMSEESEK